MTPTRPRAPSPAERIVREKGLPLRATARFLGISERRLRERLRANDLDYGRAAQLAQLCGCSPWCFHVLSLARERWEEEER